MRLARRYRLALRAYPAGYRASRGAELAATLADGDEERGRPSSREAAALARQGLSMRAGVAASGPGLLVTAAIVVLVAVGGGFVWAERVFLFRGEAAAIGSDGPGPWLGLALALSAYVVLAAGPFRAAEDPRRRRTAVLLAPLVALGAFTAPFRLVTAPSTTIEYLSWAPAAIFHNWSLTLPMCIASVLATAIALRVLGRRTMALALAGLSALAVAQAWHRPDLPAEYGRSALADLGPATFIAAAGCLLALAALRSRPDDGRDDTGGDAGADRSRRRQARGARRARQGDAR